MQFDEALKLQQKFKEAGSPKHVHHYMREHHHSMGTGDEACTVCGDMQQRVAITDLTRRAIEILRKADFDENPNDLARWAKECKKNGADPDKVSVHVLRNGQIQTEVPTSRTDPETKIFTAQSTTMTPGNRGVASEDFIVVRLRDLLP